MKALDGFEKSFGGQQDFDGPLDRAKLEAEIKPVVKDIKPSVKKDIKTAQIKTAQKATTNAQAAHKQAPAPKKPALAKTAAKPVPHQQPTRLAAQPAKPKAQQPQQKVSKK